MELLLAAGSLAVAAPAGWYFLRTSRAEAWGVLCCPKCLRIVAWTTTSIGFFDYHNGGCVCRPEQANMLAVEDIHARASGWPRQGEILVDLVYDEARWVGGTLLGEWMPDKLRSELESLGRKLVTAGVPR